MSRYKQGNMFDHFPVYDFIFVTTNSYLRKDGALVMGRGAARELKEMFTEAPYVFGAMIRNSCGHLGEYNLLNYPIDGLGISVGAFQVKYHFLDKANLGLIQRGCEKLKREALYFSNKTFCINFPGIGNGGLSKAIVEMFVDLLPENIDVWEK